MTQYDDPITRHEQGGTLSHELSHERAARTRLERRTRLLETAADLSRVVAPMHEVQDLLGAACRFLYDQLDVSFTAIYLVDEFQKWAVLRAGSGEAGDTLVMQGFQLSLEELSPLTQALHQEAPLLIYDGHEVSKPASRPLPPLTTMAVVVPLRSNGVLLGFWTAHSDSPDTFMARDTNDLRLIGDNLAHAIENADLYAHARESVQELERAQRGYVRTAWGLELLNKKLVYSQRHDGFDRPGGDTQQLAPPPSEQAAEGALSVPITLRGQVIGSVDLFDVTQTRQWNESEKALAASVVEQMALAVENARLFEEAQRRAQETAIINEMARELSGELDQENVFAKVYAYLPRLMPTDAFIVWFYDELSNTVTRPVLYDLGRHYVAYLKPEPTTPRLAQVIETNAPVVINLSRQEWEIERAKTETIFGSSEPSASLMYVPLRIGNKIRGILSAQTYQLGAYGEAQAAILTAVANYVATALENAQLFAETTTALNETQTLYSVGARLNQVTSLEELVRIAAQPAFEQGAGSAQLWMIDYQDQVTPIAANVIVSLIAPGEPAALSTYTHFPIEQFELGRAMLENPRELVLIEDVASSPLLDETTRQILLASNDRAEVLLPLTVEERVLGAIAIGWAEPHTFSAQERRIYQALSGQLALALNNRLLFDQTQEALAETQTLYEISARLNASANVQEALEAAAGPAIVQGAATASLLRLVVDEDNTPTALEFSALWPRNSEMAMPPGTRIPLEFLAGQAAWLENPTEPLLVQETQTDERVGEPARAAYLQNEIRSTALLPLKIADRWIGALNFNWSSSHPFTPRDARLYRALMAQASTVLDNRSLFEQTQDALARTQTALTQAQEAQDCLNVQYQTANTLARANSFDQAAPELLESLCGALNWQIGEYWSVNESSNHLVLSHLWTEDSAALKEFSADSLGLTFGPGEGLSGRTWTGGLPIWIPNLAEDPNFRQKAQAETAGLLSALAFPLQSEARQYGVTVFFSTHSQPMDDNLMATMVGVGNQISQYLERRRAEEAVRQQNTYLTALHDTTLGLMRRLDLDELLQNIITRAAELVGTEHGYVHLIEPSGAELRMRVGVGIYQDFIGTRVKRGQGLAGTVWRDEAPIIVDDYRTWSGRLPMVDRDVLRAVAGVPLISHSQTVGVLGLASLQEGHTFSPAQVEALNRFAELATVALDNAQLYNESQRALAQTQRLAQREKTSSEIADKLYAASDVSSVLRTAAEELRRSTGSKRAIVRLNSTDSPSQGGNTTSTGTAPNNTVPPNGNH